MNQILKPSINKKDLISFKKQLKILNDYIHLLMRIEDILQKYIEFDVVDFIYG